MISKLLEIVILKNQQVVKNVVLFGVAPVVQWISVLHF